jgi:hypothetical protein
MKVTHAGVRDVLATVGPLLSHEVAEFFPGSTHQEVSAVLSTMRRAAKKQVRIVSWTRQTNVGKTYLRAVYALGDGPDARKPRAFNNAQKCARRRAKRALPRVANSVFAWAGGAV